MGMIAAVWAILGVTALLGSAIFRLSPLVWELDFTTMAPGYWLAFVLSVGYMLWAEGYKGFHQAFSPRFAARAAYLIEHPSLVRGIFAPLFCMGFFQSSKRRMIISYALTLSIVVLIVYVHTLTQPWRGIIDAGVVAGLSLGLISTLYHCAKALNGTLGNIDPELAPGMQQYDFAPTTEAEAA